MLSDIQMEDKSLISKIKTRHEKASQRLHNGIRGIFGLTKKNRPPTQPASNPVVPLLKQEGGWWIFGNSKKKKAQKELNERRRRNKELVNKSWANYYKSKESPLEALAPETASDVLDQFTEAVKNASKIRNMNSPQFKAAGEKIERLEQQARELGVPDKNFEGIIKSQFVNRYNNYTRREKNFNTLFGNLPKLPRKGERAGRLSLNLPKGNNEKPFINLNKEEKNFFMSNPPGTTRKNLNKEEKNFFMSNPSGTTRKNLNKEEKNFFMSNPSDTTRKNLNKEEKNFFKSDPYVKERENAEKQKAIEREFSENEGGKKYKADLLSQYKNAYESLVSTNNSLTKNALQQKKKIQQTLSELENKAELANIKLADMKAVRDQFKDRLAKKQETMLKKYFLNQVNTYLSTPKPKWNQVNDEVIRQTIAQAPRDERAKIKQFMDTSTAAIERFAEAHKSGRRGDTKPAWEAFVAAQDGLTKLTMKQPNSVVDEMKRLRTAAKTTVSLPQLNNLMTFN
jgi:hypothetical protein